MDHDQHIDWYITEERHYNAIYNPYETPSFPVHVSPPMTREKQNQTKDMQ